MFYVLLIEFLYCLFKVIVKAFKTNFIKKFNELVFQKRLTKVTNLKTIFLLNFKSGKSTKKVRNSKKIVFEWK